MSLGYNHGWHTSVGPGRQGVARCAALLKHRPQGSYAVPNNLNADRHQDERREAGHDIGAGWTKEFYKPDCIFIAEPDQYAQQKHPRQYRQSHRKTQDIPVAGNLAEMRADGDRYGHGAGVHG